LNPPVQLGFISELERVKTKITAVNSAIGPQSGKNEAFYAHPAVSAYPLTLYYATKQYNSFRKGVGVSKYFVP
jgi:hypothetical protein